VWISDSSSSASVSGRTGRCSNAAAVSVRRGSATTTRPPRATIASSASRIRGVVTSDPWLTSGLAPIISSRLVRSMSGIGTSRGES
jgi:hypothetical protein